MLCHQAARAEYLLISSVYSLFGGSTTILIGVYSFISDTSSVDTRTVRVALLDVAMVAGYTTGNFLSAPVYEQWGFYGSFGSSLLFLTADFLFVIFVLQESR